MNLVDSCGWLEYFADGENAEFFAPAITDTANLLVPTLAFFEVFKRILQQREENAALQAVAMMQQGTVVDLTADISLRAAKLAVTHKLPMADSVMLATARRYQARLWTQDGDFEGMRVCTTAVR
ncbi:type II toxin-antitoxin system VapC family toxin [Thioalkalivibrio sulfidiphilus]|uniref:type II toxin-antitoxin system VapC family toxin n=1 Tax=Thioalkalivibrio sulfidiphilus TaxID=1033854 RepID=UPI003B36EDA6